MQMSADLELAGYVERTRATDLGDIIALPRARPARQTWRAATAESVWIVRVEPGRWRTPPQTAGQIPPHKPPEMGRTPLLVVEGRTKTDVSCPQLAHGQRRERRQRLSPAPRVAI